MAQRPNITMLTVRVNFMGILSDSVRVKFMEILSDSVSADGYWEMKMWLYQKLIQICERLGFWQYTLKFISP